MPMKNIYLSCLLLILTCLTTYATHLKGGEIRATHVTGQAYKISVLLYLDTTGGADAGTTENTLNVCMGDGSVITAARTSFTTLPDQPEIALAMYEGNYTYQSPGIYQISAQLSNRSGNMLNFENSESTPLFLWTVLHTAVANSTPVLPLPTYSAGIKQPFVLDLNATDAEGDSISYTLQKLSRPSPGTCGVRSTYDRYVYPNAVGALGTYKLNQTEKKLIWTAPTQEGQYIYAVVMHEWREGVRISETYREGIIHVTHRPGETVEIPPYEDAETGGPVTGGSPEITLSVDAYPVPADDYVSVKVYSKTPSMITLRVIDLNGRVHQEYKSKALNRNLDHQFDLRNYARGIYVISASNESDTVSKKVLKR